VNITRVGDVFSSLFLEERYGSTDDLTGEDMRNGIWGRWFVKVNG
jgi:hypothetical protein